MDVEHADRINTAWQQQQQGDPMDLDDHQGNSSQHRDPTDHAEGSQEPAGVQEPVSPTPDIDEAKLNAAIVARVHAWGACSASYLNAYLRELQQVLQGLEQQQQQVRQAVAALAAAAAGAQAGSSAVEAAAAGGTTAAAAAAAPPAAEDAEGAPAGSMQSGAAAAGQQSQPAKPHVPGADVDPCVAALVQRAFDAVTGKAAAAAAGSGAAIGMQKQEQSQKQQQQQPGMVLPVSARQQLEAQSRMLLEQLDDTLLLLKAEVVSMVPFR
jgi:hypothetical protein